ncbi:MAG TPA: 16S rRNA pseudouridine(516) synthase, partial [Globicatella sulfidifaciens]|nr:16S rRNA pseudouridine(516) synthase [Globicatella sulfidifaciens]
MRLDKFLIKTLQLTKQQRKRLLADHQILIDGHRALSLRQNIDSELQKITVRGQQIVSPTEKYYMMYKP